MKKFLIGLFILGLTNLTFSQQQLAVVNYNSDVAVERNKNVDFLSVFAKEDMASRIQKLQKVVADYDITSKSIFKADDPSTYKVVFKEGKNEVIAVYNQDGYMVSSEGKYVNIRLPYVIGKDLSKTYPGWRFNKNHCTIDYLESGKTNIIYTVQLEKGNRKKTVKINAANYN